MEINYFVAITALMTFNLVFTVAGFGLILYELKKEPTNGNAMPR